jgi:hypothetical protein
MTDPTPVSTLLVLGHDRTRTIVTPSHYLRHEGQKYHGNDLQTMQSEGVRVTVLDKNYTQEDVAKARSYE